MRFDYLQGLEKRYEEWIATYQWPLIIVNGEYCKFGNRSEDFKMVTDMIEAKLYGFFPNGVTSPECGRGISSSPKRCLKQHQPILQFQIRIPEHRI